MKSGCCCRCCSCCLFCVALQGKTKKKKKKKKKEKERKGKGKEPSKRKKEDNNQNKRKNSCHANKSAPVYSGVQWKKWAEFDVEIPLKAFIVAVWGMLLSEKGKCPHCRFVLPASIRPPAPNLSWGLHATFSWANHVPDLRSLSSLTAVPRKCTLSKKKRSTLALSTKGN